MRENNRKTTINVEHYSKMFRSWFESFDKKYFFDFFSDKDVTIDFEDNEEFNRGPNACLGMVWPWNSAISINPAILPTYTIEELKDTLLHEMIHHWVYCVYPTGRTCWKENSRAFKEWSQMLKCPPAGRRVHQATSANFWMCYRCGTWNDEKRGVFRWKCPDCKGPIKHYASRRCGRHL